MFCIRKTLPSSRMGCFDANDWRRVSGAGQPKPRQGDRQISRGPSGRGIMRLSYPGHRPAAEALGLGLPARWAGSPVRGLKSDSSDAAWIARELHSRAGLPASFPALPCPPLG
jgi:hypothetical protein